MPFLKHSLLWVFFIVAMYLGGSATQSSGNLMQGIGFISIVMAFVCLYIIFKLVWVSRGTITTVLVIGGVVLYCAYTLGITGDKTLSGVMTGEQPVVEKSTDNGDEMAAQRQEMESLGVEMFGSGDGNENTEQQEPGNQTSANNTGFLNKVKNMVSGNSSKQYSGTVQYMDINPFDYPSVSGSARVVTGSTVNIKGLNIKMYGIDAPDITQTCANHFGQGYYCGREARSWLQNWINNRIVTCHILGKVENGWATGTCFVDNNSYDLAAVVVNAGWAVAYTKNTDIYVAYENQANANRRGLWAGRFYKPWDWRKIQNRKVDIKIEYNPPKATSKSGKGGFDFWGLF